jgi:hypothetical protein
MKTLLIAAALLVTASGAHSQQSLETTNTTLHVKSVNNETAQEHAARHTMFLNTIVVGTIGNKVYTLASTDNRSFLEVGADYPVRFKNNRDVFVTIPGKKHPIEIFFFVKGEEEK